MNRRLWLVVAVVVAALGFLVSKGLGDATTYFRNADEALADRRELGARRFRLQGTVVDGSVEETATSASFEVAYNCQRVRVRHGGGQAPPLFKPGIPVVLEGRFAPGSDVYQSDRIIVKHTSEYREDEQDRLALARDEACPR